MTTWVTWVRDPNTGASFRVTAQADSAGTARMIFENQYGSQNVLHLPTPA